MKTKIKLVTGKILFELVIVSLGILLALAVNSWFENHQQKQQAGDLLKKLEYEISYNLKSLKEVDAAFIESIELTNRYISELEAGKKVDPNYSISILAVDFGVWKFTQYRKELDHLPVDMMIAISESYRALEKAEVFTLDLAFSKFDDFMDNVSGNENIILKKVLRELKQAKFYLNMAQINLKNSIEIIEKHRLK